jgi:phosphatidylcholine synthase
MSHLVGSPSGGNTSSVQLVPSSVAEGYAMTEISKLRIAAAWLVHLYTAMGLALGAAAAVNIIAGGAANWRTALALLLAAVIVDATDGTFARLIDVKRVLPQFDGARLDDIIDYMNYTAFPLLLVWRAELMPGWSAAWLLVPLLASAYGFCQTAAKTDDGFFVGFPSYWNIVAFYFYVLRPPGWLALGLVLLFSFLTFVPLRYLYPTRGEKLARLTLWLGGVWTVLLLWILWNLPRSDQSGDVDHAIFLTALASLAFPVYYLAASWTLNAVDHRPR